MTGRECQGESCCRALSVPTQSFTLGGSVESPTSAATVSGFSLDKYEVTVGRFRAFLSVYDDWRRAGNPVAGAARHPLIEGSGWGDDWELAESASDIASQAGVECSALTQTFTAERPELPINCVTWLEAAAFCAWDGARLPTEAEWEAAATGGDEGRTFPWGSDEPDPSRAAYDCTGDGSPAQDCAVSDILDVGSRSQGAGRWGHLDLAGNVWEWVLDWYRSYPAVADDFASVAPGAYRAIRGSGWYSEARELRSSIRYNSAPTARRSEFGFRCAGAR
jgi:sulfatase modifying factor 1